MGAATKVLSPTGSLKMEGWLSARHWANVWSQFNLVGPLSLPWLAAVLVVLAATGRARDVRIAFLLVGTVALLAPRFVIGEGALGAARDWDIFAAPALVVPVTGLVLLTGVLDPVRSRRVVLALLAASLFHTVPWIALNVDVERTMARIARLPLSYGRGETMIGTYYSESGLGLALARQNRLPEAVGPMVAAVRLRPGVIPYKDDLITLFVALERWDDADAVLRDRLGYQPQHLPSWLMLARCRTECGDVDGEVEVLEAARRTVGDVPSLRTALADAFEQAIRVHGRRGEWRAARVMVDRFAAAFPDDPRVAPFRVALSSGPK